ncbi:hypothetical protein BCV70DRAFT_91693 [Testicularia cyperi]|uniref:Acid protease n=1 Tax=Testicularia cyperi TaxID=1882483 RepID=A0A317XSI9_9BASI|nr:hypothetical protein BCV70DRAFT_91693 [Testicularia cyperi]
MMGSAASLSRLLRLAVFLLVVAVAIECVGTNHHRRRVGSHFREKKSGLPAAADTNPDTRRGDVERRSRHASDLELVRRDDSQPQAGETVIPLAYDIDSNLYTAMVKVGSNAYKTIVDTGSAFLLLQQHAFQTTSSTKTIPNQPQIHGSFATTNPDGSGTDQDPKLTFYNDQAGLVDVNGAAPEKDSIIALTQLPDLDVDGILGLGPPFSAVAHANAPKSHRKRELTTLLSRSDDPEKTGKGAGGSGSGGGGGDGGGSDSDLDVAFLHSFFGGGRPGSDAHFYLALDDQHADAAKASTGKLVFPTGSTCPLDVAGYNSAGLFQVDANSGSTFPKAPFWGIAHNPTLKMMVGGTVLDEIRIDAVVLDSGTSGIVGPKSEVAKLIDVLSGAVQPHQDTKSSSFGATTACDGTGLSGAQKTLAFQFGGKVLPFSNIRRDNYMRFLQADGATTTPSLEPKHRADVALKSYIEAGAKAYLGFIGGVTDFFRHLIGFGLGKRTIDITLGPDPSDKGDDEFTATPDPQTTPASKLSQCTLAVVGNDIVDHMTPQGHPDFKVWILGQEFFAQNLVYHNIDKAVTTIIPRQASS